MNKQTTSTSGRTKVLLVDDHPAFRETMRAFLPESAFDFMECSNGREAVECFEREHPEWVVMDVKMPEMDGIEATRRICAACPEARIILVSQYDDAMTREEGLAAGALHFFTKDNLTKLRNLLSTSKESTFKGEIQRRSHGSTYRTQRNTGKENKT